ELRRGRIARRVAVVGLLLRADPAVRRRVHAGLRALDRQPERAGEDDGEREGTGIAAGSAASRRGRAADRLQHRAGEGQRRCREDRGRRRRGAHPRHDRRRSRRNADGREVGEEALHLKRKTPSPGEGRGRQISSIRNAYCDATDEFVLLPPLPMIMFVVKPVTVPPLRKTPCTVLPKIMQWLSRMTGTPPVRPAKTPC